MKIISTNIKNKKGEVKVVAESIDDLWHLKNIIEKGDKVFALTKRTVESKDKNKLRSDKERVTVKIGVEVERTEFHKFLGALRVLGKIVAGVDESGYHTLNIVPGKEVHIIKDCWKDEQLKRIKKASEVKRPEIVIVTIEECEAVIGAVRDWGVEEITSVRRSYGKDLGNYRREFFGEVLSIIEKIKSDYIILAGPGFTKEDFLKFLKEKKIDGKIIIENTSSIGVRGFSEVIKRGSFAKIVKDTRLKEEVEYIEKLILFLIKNKAVCGLESVIKANNYRCIQTLLISDNFLQKEREKWDIDSLISEVEKRGGKVIIMSSEFEPGKRLEALGGIAAILRFRIPELIESS